MEWFNQPWGIQAGFGLAFLLIVVAFFYIRSQHIRIKKLQAEVESWLVDPLTGLLSRRRAMDIYYWLFDQVYAALYKIDEDRRDDDAAWKNLAVIMFDLDHSRKILEIHGQATAESVAVKFGELLKREIRNADLAGRYGDDEFIVLLATNLAGAKAFSTRVRLNFKKLRFENKKKPFSATVSCGLTVIDSDSDRDTFVERAISALKVAKSSGRDCVAIWGRERTEIIK
ncbi:MAG: GGDEF domain-containing protein [Patescibacteria group bacterium]